MTVCMWQAASAKAACRQLPVMLQAVFAKQKKSIAGLIGLVHECFVLQYRSTCCQALEHAVCTDSVLVNVFAAAGSDGAVSVTGGLTAPWQLVVHIL